MEHFIEQAHSGHWIDSRFGDSASSLPAIDDICIPSSSCYHHWEMNAACLSGDSVSMRSPLLPQLVQETYATVMCPTSLRRPHIRKEMESLPLPHANATFPLHNSPYYSRCNVSDGSKSAQASAPQASPTWCQSYINRPRPDGTLADAVSSGEAAYDKADGKRETHNAQFRGKKGGEHAGPSQLMQSDAQQLHQKIEGCHQGLAPQTGIHTGVAQLQGVAEAVAGTARPRVRARRGQATDPHSIAERLRRERIAERMKALQELVPNANKTDKPSMLDEIIDYVKFLQLQVKVLSMSRLGGAGAVAPLIADFQGQGQVNLVAALHPSGCRDGMAVAEQQVARLMEEDMGSAMQFLQAKGLCLMPISLASVISDKNSQRMMGACGGSIRQHIIQGMDQASMHTASSTSSTLASVISSRCLGVKRDK